MSKQYDSQHQKHSLTRTNLSHIQYTVQWGGGERGEPGRKGVQGNVQEVGRERAGTSIPNKAGSGRN